MFHAYCGSQRWVALCLIAFFGLALPGCVPTTWLPDSSGFVFVKPIGGQRALHERPRKAAQLVHHDLKKNASRVVVEDIGTGTFWPAVSPDGKRIAISRIKDDGMKKKIQIAMYDLQGKQLLQSKEFDWSEGNGKAYNPGILFWSPKDDMLLVTSSTLETTGIYNVAADTLKVIQEQTMPVAHGGSPIRPDGKRFLAMRGNVIDGHGRLVFVDWTGAEQRIDVTKMIAVLRPQDAKDPVVAGTADAIFLSAAMSRPSGWDGTMAWVGSKRSKTTFTVDTEKNTVAVSDGFAALAGRKGDPLTESQFDFAGDVSIRTTQFTEGKAGTKEEKGFNRVVVVNHKTGKEEVLFAKAPPSTMFLPSPNGNYLALCLGTSWEGGPDPAQILVITNMANSMSS